MTGVIHHTDEARAKISRARRGMLPVWKRPNRCEKCGAEVRRSKIERWRGEWLCPDCLNLPFERLNVEDFVSSGTSNLADAEPEGPTGTQAVVGDVLPRWKVGR